MHAERAPLPLIDGRFRLLKLLAVGGMGELYLAIARDTEIEGLEQLVVMKRILPEFAADRDIVTMFLTEARIAARLDHPNVVRVFDMGKADGSLYFTMEYLHGADLGRLWETTRANKAVFPLGCAIAITLGMCAGLHFAHEMCRIDGRPLGVVHRDVSPGNVFITYEGEVKVVDFGIAKVRSSQRLTRDGVRKGKWAYMSPEQVRGDPVDRRSDIYAIGILMYEMLTLSYLFDGESEFEIMNKISRGEFARPSERRPGIASGLERIILKCLALRREDRYATALELAEDIERFCVRQHVRLSMLALQQFVRRTIGDAEYPWYLDEEGPEEAAAVQKWFDSALPDAGVEEVEMFDVDLDDMFDGDEEAYADEDEAAEEPTNVAPAPVAPPRRPRPSRRRVVGAAGAAAAFLALLVWRCGGEEAPSGLIPGALSRVPPPRVPVPVPAPPVTAPPAAPPEAPVEVDVPEPAPAKKRVKKKKKPAKKKRR